MSEVIKIGFVVGSLRNDSANRKLALTMMDFCGKFAEAAIIEIRDLAFYNPDLDNDPPKEWVTFRDEIEKSDCILLVTPEYNRSFPPALKNALDVGGSPVLRNVWDNKCVGIASVSRGKFAEWNSNDHLVQSLQFLNALIYEDRSVRLGLPEIIFSDEGGLADHEIEKLIRRFLENFTAWAKHQQPV